MSDKSKRKGNPRRQFLFRLLLITGLVAAVIAAIVYVLYPKSAQIVFIAPDDEGVDQIWLASLNDLENPRQLTTIEDFSLSDLQVATDSSMILYKTVSDGTTQSIDVINVATGRHDLLVNCPGENDCRRILLDPGGRWVAIEDIYLSRNEASIRLCHIARLVCDPIYITEPGENYELRSLSVAWIEETGLLVYRTDAYSDRTQIAFYDIHSNQVVQTATLNERNPNSAIFSPDASIYVERLYVFEEFSRSQLFAYALDDPLDTLFESPRYELTNDYYIHFFDWLDNDTILIGEEWDTDSPGEVIEEFSLYNIRDNTRTNLITYQGRTSYQSASLNHDNSLMLYSIFEDNLPFEPQIMLYDMASEEEIPLPLFAWYPAWVNGGR